MIFTQNIIKGIKTMSIGRLKYPEALDISGLEHAYLNGEKVTFYNKRDENGYRHRECISGWYKKAWAIARKRMSA